MFDPLRDRAQACLSPGAYLRRDRISALYVALTDERGRAALEKAGFQVRARGELTEIYITPALLPALRARVPDSPRDALWAQLNRLRDKPATQGELFLLCEALKGPGPAFERKLRQTAALCLRNGGGGALALCRALQLYSSTNP